MARYERLTAGLTVAGEASWEDIERVATSLDLRFPRDLVEFYESSDGAEGWVANAYLAMWPVGELVELNNAARVADFCPGLVIVATDGGGDGYGLDTRSGTFVRVPMIGMTWDLAEPVGSTFQELLVWLAERAPVPGPQPSLDPAKLGLIVYEITPIIFEGSPTDPANKALVSLRDYVRMVAWWNERVETARNPFPSDHPTAT